MHINEITATIADALVIAATLPLNTDLVDIIAEKMNRAREAAAAANLTWQELLNEGEQRARNTAATANLSWQLNVQN